MEVTVDMFSFGKRKAEPSKSGGSVDGHGKTSASAVKSAVEMLTKNPCLNLNHRQELNRAAKKLDKFLSERLTKVPVESVEAAKLKVKDVSDESSLLASLMSDPKLVDCLAAEVVDLQVRGAE